MAKNLPFLVLGFHYQDLVDLVDGFCDFHYLETVSSV